MATTRQRRVAELVKEQVGLILQQEVSDPHIGFVTVTEAEVTADLREARVFVSVLGDAAQAKESMVGLERAAGYIRKLLGRRVDLRVVPELTFEQDTSLARGSHVLDLLHQLEEEKGEDTGG